MPDPDRLDRWRQEDAAARDAKAELRAAEREARRQAWVAGHEAELERRRLARAAQREAKSDEWQDSHVDDHESADVAHDRLMAERLGITVEAFRELQAERRREVQGKPKVGYAPSHEVR